MTKYYTVYDTAANVAVLQLTLPDDVDPAAQLQPGQHYQENESGRHQLMTTLLRPGLGQQLG